MSAKQLSFSDDARISMLRGVEQFARAVKATLGPRGRYALLDRPSRDSPVVTKDGVSVAQEVDLPDPYESMATRLIREAAMKTGKVAGDGTTTAVVLAEAVFREGVRYLAMGASAQEVKRGLDHAVAVATAALKWMSRPCEGRDDLRRIATIAANGDERVGAVMADALDRVGAQGAVTIEDGRGLETTVTLVQGTWFDGGYITSAFASRQESPEIVLEHPYILISDSRLGAYEEVLSILESVAQEKGSLLIVAGDVEGAALASLVINHRKGVLPVVAVKVPEVGQHRKDRLEDLAVVTGGRAFLEELGASIASASLSDLGRAKRAIVTADRTTILDGAGEAQTITARMATLHSQRDLAQGEQERTRLHERVARLGNAVAVIQVGAATETEQMEKKTRLDNVLRAGRAALEEGTVPGGGVALIRCLHALAPVELPGDQQVGVKILRRALEAPLRQIAENAGSSGTVVVEDVCHEIGDLGFDAATGTYRDLGLAGILDPTKVVRSALDHAASVAGLMLTTEVLLTDEQRQKKQPDQAGGMSDERVPADRISGA